MVRAVRSWPRAAQLYEVLWRRKAHEETPVVAQDTPEFTRVHARGDGHYHGKRTVGVRYAAIGIGHDPFALRVTPGRGFDRGNGNINSMPAESNLAGQAAQVESVTAAGI